jgi:uncharacterized membrane protein
MRAFILSHDNDPIAALNLPLAVKKPAWMGKERGRNVPSDARWVPFITFFQTAIDAANAMVNVPGDFRSFGHDYRADMASFVRAAFDFDATDEQLANVDEMLRRLEVERADRTKKPTDGEASGGTAAQSPQKAAERLEAGVPVHHFKQKER